jgi:hypothetical protein
VAEIGNLALDPQPTQDQILGENIAEIPDDLAYAEDAIHLGDFQQRLPKLHSRAVLYQEPLERAGPVNAHFMLELHGCNYSDDVAFADALALLDILRHAGLGGAMEHSHPLGDEHVWSFGLRRVGKLGRGFASLEG